MSGIDDLLGILLASTWLNSILFGVQLLQLRKYLKTYADEVWVKTVVLVLYFVDVMGLLGQYTTVYMDAVTNYGNTGYLGAPEPAPRGLYLSAIQTQGLIVQCYLTSRIWRLSGNLWISLVLWTGSLLSFGGGLALTIINCIHKSLADRARQSHVTSIWLITAAVVDVLIASILVYYFSIVRRNSTFAETHHVLTRLIRSSVETGSVTAVLAIIVVVLFDVLQKTNWPVGFVFILGRAYCLTMMYNLNARAELRAQNENSRRSNTLSLSARPPVFCTPTTYPSQPSMTYQDGIGIEAVETQISTSQKSVPLVTETVVEHRRSRSSDDGQRTV